MYRKALVSCLICISIFNVNINSTDNVQSKIETKKSYNSHEEINGFQWTTGFVNKSVNKDPVGYFYYDVDVYSTDFTNCSKLFLLHTKGEFTSGYIAKQNDPNSNYYDSNYDLWSGYIHSSFIRHTSDGMTSSSFVPKTSWPQSSNFTSTISSSFSTSLSIGSQLGAEADICGGLIISRVSSSSITFSFDKSVAVSGPEPFISSQTSLTNINAQQWNYQYNAVGKATYVLDTYQLFEVKNDGVNCSQYSFDYQVSVKMTNIAWKGYWWEQKNSVDKIFKTYYGTI